MSEPTQGGASGIPEPPASLDRLREQLALPGVGESLVKSRPGRGGRRAAVLILLSLDESAARVETSETAGLRIVLIEKAAHLRRHAGQMAFPGGAVEPGDPTGVAAALREADEEVGVRPEEVRVLGTLPPAHVAASGFDAMSVVGWWRGDRVLAPGDDGEVQAVHTLPVPVLVDPLSRWVATHQSGYTGPAFVVGDLFIWGFTAHLLTGLIQLAGWEVPWDQDRRAEIPPRFLYGRR
ncbi:NUDIX hydrolase [Nigerium massiliense]|uniref:NUDIX hydrolase n=1 Tax=Nigerium massiliense TaxID=1522317 RepID=UPI000693DA17|nr:CoA pyrophosphatase [Nigerium massiliense]